MGGDQQHSYSLKVFIVCVALGLPFPQVHLSVGGGGGGGGAYRGGIHRATIGFTVTINQPEIKHTGLEP